MEFSLKLTKNPKALAETIATHVNREESRLSYRRATWLVAAHYLAGVRQFDQFDPDSGHVRWSWTTQTGELEFQSTELLSHIDRIQGRLMSSDFRPLVQRIGNSLPALRERAIAQVIADSMVGEQQLEDAKRDFGYIFTALGSCGITGHVVDHPTIGLTSDLEVVHPTELFPFPSIGYDHTKVMGLLRQRWVPLSWLQDRYGGKIKKNLKDMDWMTIQSGERLDPEMNESAPYAHSFRLNWGHGAGVPDGQPDEMDVVKVRELWLYGHKQTVSRHIITSGQYTIEDLDLSGLEVYCPIGFARFMDNGTWHGAGAFDLLFPLVREAEKMIKQLFFNTRDMDRYGVLVMPQGSFNANSMLRDIGRGLRVCPWEPDPISESFRPFSIPPFNSGDIPGRTAAFAQDQIDRVNPIRDLIQEKGRVDSAVGLSFLDEQINRAMTSPTQGIQKAFGDMYRSLVANASRTIAMSPRAIPVQRLTVDLAGAVIDPVTLEVSFEKNPLPNVSRLSFGIRQRNPRSEVARKQEALQLQQQMQIDPDTFILFAMKEGLDFAMWTDEHQSAYETVVRNVILLYGDGQVPGQIILVPEQAKPELQIRVLSAFMGGPMMMVASPEVQNQFSRYKQTLIEFMGLSLPEAVPNPDDLAMLTKIDQQLARGGQGGTPQQNGVSNEQVAQDPAFA